MITFLNLGRNGRFGNQLFQVASTIGLATRNGYQFGFPKWKNYAGKKMYLPAQNMQKYFVNPIPSVNRSDFDKVHIPYGYHNIPIDDNSSLSGYMQSHKYFEHCNDLIKHYFTLKKLSDRRLEPKSVAIHLRLTDYDGKFLIRLGREYYEKAMSRFSEDYNFYVFSDNIKLAKQIIGNNAIYITQQTYMQDFYLMHMCENFIIANSTFSWWAAWLSSNESKVIVAPKRWFGPDANLDPTDIYVKDWEVI